MSTRYSIYFTNNTGFTNTYGFFTSPPRADEQVDEIYSNVWTSFKRKNTAYVELHINKDYLAWCGTAPAQLAPDVQVSLGDTRAAELGTATAPGSTFGISNMDSEPAFDDKETHTANPGCYEIDTKTDFDPALNFLIGMAGEDNYGRRVPVASLEAAPNSKVNIQPNTEYYISVMNKEPGTVINFKEQSADAAHIDFSINPGLYGAVVNQDNFGVFNVSYAPDRDEYLHMIRDYEARGSTLEQKVDKLEKQLSTMLKYLPAAAAAETDLTHVVSKKATKGTHKANAH